MILWWIKRGLNQAYLALFAYFLLACFAFWFHDAFSLMTSHTLAFHSTSFCAVSVHTVEKLLYMFWEWWFNNDRWFFFSPLFHLLISKINQQSHLSISPGRLPLLRLPFDSSNMLTGMASSLSLSAQSISAPSRLCGAPSGTKVCSLLVGWWQR